MGPSNPHVNGHSLAVPEGLNRAARRRAGAQGAPPGPNVPEAALANVIGQAVAAQLAQLLSPAFQALAQLRSQPGCFFCVMSAKQAEQVWQVAVRNAQAAAEDPPPQPQVPIQQAITWMPVERGDQPPVCAPACYGHVQAVPAVRQVGLVTPDGRPIVSGA